MIPRYSDGRVRPFDAANSGVYPCLAIANHTWSDCYDDGVFDDYVVLVDAI